LKSDTEGGADGGGRRLKTSLASPNLDRNEDGWVTDSDWMFPATNLELKKNLSRDEKTSNVK